jgi:exodeoxyribonuclease-5
MSNEKLLCLKTNYYHQLDYENILLFPVNGMSMITLNKFSYVDDINFSLKFKPSFIEKNNNYFEANCSKLCFDNYLGDIDKDPILISENDSDDDFSSVIFDWGYSVSVHKSQGSQWNKILIIDEFQGPQDVYSKWLYTGITRAVLSCDIVKYEI